MATRRAQYSPHTTTFIYSMMYVKKTENKVTLPRQKRVYTGLHLLSTCR